MTIRFRFWLTVHDIAEKLRAPYRIQHWLLMRTAAAVDYDAITTDRSKEPF